MENLSLLSAQVMSNRLTPGLAFGVAGCGNRTTCESGWPAGTHRRSFTARIYGRSGRHLEMETLVTLPS